MHAVMAPKWFLIFLALALGCQETAVQRDGAAGDIYVSSVCPHGLDSSVDRGTAISLAEGKEASDYICPLRDKDYYKLSVPAGKRLIRVKLLHAVYNTPLDLSYKILDGAGVVVSQAPDYTGRGLRSFDDYHCVKTGTYYIQVLDEGNDQKDGNNPYKLSYQLISEPDSQEPNDTVKESKLAGSAKGYIACKGDVDYYKVPVSKKGRLIQVTLSNGGMTPVDLKYSVLDTVGNLVAQEVNSDGSRGKTALTGIYSTTKLGQYQVKVEDHNSDDSDPLVPYTLAVKILEEPDTREVPTRNDTPQSATLLGTFDCSGGVQTFSVKKAHIASRADIDYYKLVIPTCQAQVVMEVNVDFHGASKVDPQVAYIFPHASSSCTKDKCCRVLNYGCSSFLSCLRTSRACITKGDSFCQDKACQYNPSATCAIEKRCAGANVCLPGGRCGAEQAVRQDKDGSDGARIFTAQPLLHAGPWYLRVNDFKGDDIDYSRGYDLTVRLVVDPDRNRELDSEYFSEKVPQSLGINTAYYHYKKAYYKAVNIDLDETVSGYISYEGDQDWFKLHWPCEGDPCLLNVQWSYTGTGCVTGTKDTNNDTVPDDGLEFVYALRYRTGTAKDVFPGTPTTWLNGSYGYPNECLLLSGKSSYPYYYFSVSDLTHNMWSWKCGYSFKITKGAEGCAMPPCLQVGTKCYVPSP